MSREDPSALQNPLFPQTGDSVIYEQPLNERVRTFLRLEHLFELVTEGVQGDSEWASRSALGGMIELTDLLSRSDLKAEIIKELERQSAVLEGLRNKPGVDAARLGETLDSVSALVEQLRSNACQPGQLLRRDELVTSIRQRTAIPGGTCNFDLPAFHHWLAQPAATRRERLLHWFSDLRCLEEGSGLALRLLRESASPTRELAAGGFFQKALDPAQGCQLIRVGLAGSETCYPEISAGRHRFTIRFLEQRDTEQRPGQLDRDVRFELERCVI